MATRTFIDGGKQAITFNNDTEPVAVYVDGELQQNVSFVPQLAQGTGSAQYTSEYKKNIINCELTGTTEQGTYVGNIVQTSSLTPYASFVEDFTINSYGRILRSTQPIVFPTTSGSVVAKLVDYESIESQIPDYETLFLINENKDTLYILYSVNTEYSQLIPPNDTYYLGIADEMDAGNDNVRCYNLFVENAKLQVSYVGTSTTPTPETPIPIENANDNGMSVVVRSPNLLQFKDYSDSRTDSDGNVLTWEVKDGIVTVNGKQNKLAFVTLDYKSFVTEVYGAGTYSYTASYYRDGNNVGGCDWAFRYADDWTSRITGYTDGRTSRIVETKTIDKPFRLGYVQLYIYANTEYKDFKFTIGLFKGSYTGATMPPYSTYFREEIAIPTSVEVDNGDGTTKTVDLPFTLYDKLIVDRVANTVTYEKKSGVKVFTGTEGFLASTSNNNDLYNYRIELYKIGFNETTSNGYCSHFTPVPRADYSEKYDVCFDVTDAFGDTSIYFLYDKLDNDFFTARDMFKSWVAEQYNAGTPLTIVVEYEEVEPIDITQSSLAQSLLNLATQNQTNYFEITSNEKAPQVPIKINYAKWGELVENNNNT